MSIVAVNRATVRQQFANLLSMRLGTYAVVYAYQVGDFRGQSPVVLVTSSSSTRGDQLNSSETMFDLQVHTFVLYALRPVQSSADVTSGVDVLILLDDTSIFQVGMTVTVEDPITGAREMSDVVSIDANVSITVDEVLNTYETPLVYVWTEQQSEDLIDYLEQQITDEVRLANDADLWLSIAVQDASEIDAVEIGGDAYRHETISVRAVVEDF